MIPKKVGLCSLPTDLTMVTAPSAPTMFAPSKHSECCGVPQIVEREKSVLPSNGPQQNHQSGF